MGIGLGIDTGGTCTDAVLYDFTQRRILAGAKSLTTKEDLALGIGAALDQLPVELLRRTERVALSTTLATNACVENKGGRAGLILIGGDRQVVEKNGNQYGLPSADHIYFLDAELAEDGTVRREPDWERFRQESAAFLKGLEAAAVVSYQGIRNPALEKQAQEILKESGVRAIGGHELFWDRNYIRRGASTLLNARLLPVIDTFLQAVDRTLMEREIHAPMVVVRSDGSLMSESFSRERPVETILCGPAASVMAGMHLAGCPDCLVVDMGGTTTDIALVRGGIPVKESDGVTIGQWRTFVKSVDIHTIGLGGDSVVRLDGQGGVSIGPERVMPLCSAAVRWPWIREELEELARSGRTSACPLQEFFCLVRDIAGREGYTDREYRICEALRDGALRIDRLAEAAQGDTYTLDTRRLEREGVVLRCGVTPTDVMHVLGDYTAFDRQAASAAVAYLAQRLEMEPEAFGRMVFDQIKRTLYEQLVHILLENENSAYKGMQGPGLDRLIRDSWNRSHDQEKSLLRLSLETSAVLVGIGAPTHLFLPQVAEKLGTRCVIPPEAAVANALGALVGHIAAAVTAEIEPFISESGQDQFRIYTSRQHFTAVEEEEAIKIALKTAEEEAVAEARRRGAAGELTITSRVEPVMAKVGHSLIDVQEICVCTHVTVTAAGGTGF